VTWGDSTAYDGTVNGPTFQPNGGVTDFENGSGSGAYEDFTTGGIELPGFDITNTFSVSAWVNYQTLDEGDDLYILEGFSPDNAPLFYYNDNTALKVFNDGSGVATSNSINLDSGEYYHTTFTYDGSNIGFYFNGNNVGTGTGTFPTNPDNWVIGRGNANDGGADYKIDDVRIYNRPLTDSEISDIHNATKP